MCPETTKNVALIGSSGGGTATLDHTDCRTLLRTIHEQLQRCGGCLAVASFVVLDGGKGMDGANQANDSATLFAVNFGDSTILECCVQKMGSLRDVNAEIQNKDDERIAREILNGNIDGLICISCHIGLYEKTLVAAAAAKIPITGSGGTSLSHAVAKYGLMLTGNAGGSVATTSFSRAVSYTHAFAAYWGRDYRPWNDESVWGDIQWTSILNACLPVFWGSCLAKRLVTCLLEKELDTWVHFELISSLIFVYAALEQWVLPAACAVIMVSSSSSSGKGHAERDDLPLSSLLMASAIASSVCRQSVLAGLLAGWLVGQLAHPIFFHCIVNNVPATMMNLISGGGTGCLVGITLVPVAPVLGWCTAWIRSVIAWTLTGLPNALLGEGETAYIIGRAIVGFIWGCLCCYGSKVGLYHAYVLPIILLEMEMGEASFLGAIDELTLVLVCAGICAGNLAARKLFGLLKLDKDRVISDAEASLCRRGLSTNLLYGDFVEVCYPFMEQSTIINVGGYIASGLSSAWLVATIKTTIPKSLAYLPLPLSIVLAGTDWQRMMEAAFLAFAISFFAAFASPLFVQPKRKQS